MTNKEAIRRLRDHFATHDDGRPTPYLNEAIRIAYDALEKQTPKKYWNHHCSTLGAVDFTIECCCPNCNRSLRCKGQKYCHECGQAISWEGGDAE